MAVPATGLVADFESIGQAFEDSHHLIDRPHLGAVDELPRLVEHADRDMFAVDVEPDVEHDDLRKLETVRTCTTGSTLPLTEASYIDSHRRHLPDVPNLVRRKRGPKTLSAAAVRCSVWFGTAAHCRDWLCRLDITTRCLGTRLSQPAVAQKDRQHKDQQDGHPNVVGREVRQPQSKYGD